MPCRDSSWKFVLGFCAALLTLATPAPAQEWPAHPIRFIVSFGPGGADTLRTSCTMIRSGSQIGNGYSGTFLLKPTTVGLKPE